MRKRRNPVMSQIAMATEAVPVAWDELKDSAEESLQVGRDVTSHLRKREFGAAAKRYATGLPSAMFSAWKVGAKTAIAAVAAAETAEKMLPDKPKKKKKKGMRDNEIKDNPLASPSLSEMQIYARKRAAIMVKALHQKPSVVLLNWLEKGGTPGPAVRSAVAKWLNATTPQMWAKDEDFDAHDAAKAALWAVEAADSRNPQVVADRAKAIEEMAKARSYQLMRQVKKNPSYFYDVVDRFGNWTREMIDTSQLYEVGEYIEKMYRGMPRVFKVLKKPVKKYKGVVVELHANVKMLKRNPAASDLPLFQDILAHLRALQWLAITSHWTSDGQSFYGDHLLLQRIYESINAPVDELGERMVAYFGSNSVYPRLINGKVCSLLKSVEGQERFAALLSLERCLQTALKLAWKANQASGEQMSLGIDDFLMGLANSQDTTAYLLMQRVGGIKTPEVKAPNIGHIGLEEQLRQDAQNQAEEADEREAAEITASETPGWFTNPRRKPRKTRPNLNKRIRRGRR